MKLKNDMVIQVAKATKADVQQFNDFLSIIRKESDNYLHILFSELIDDDVDVPFKDVERLINFYVNSETSTLFVGKIDDEIVGIGILDAIHVLMSTGERIDHKSFIKISVKKKYRGIGIGTYLMQLLIAFAKGNGATKEIRSEIMSNNVGAAELYEKFGFSEFHRNEKYYETGNITHALILMELYL